MPEPPPNDPTRPVFDDVIARFLLAEEEGHRPDPEQLAGEYPEIAVELQAFLRARAGLDRLAATLDTPLIPPRLSEGTFGPYEVLGVLGEGGMGTVYRARQASPGREVALKVVRTDRLGLLDSDERRAWLERFRREAELVASLGPHENIVPLYDFGECGGQPYFTMPQLAGSLADRVRPRQGEAQEAAARRRAGEQRATAALVAKVARAVHHAHQRAVLHRDLKPANVLLDAEGEPVVTDFGLARRLEGDGAASASGVIGTPAYMAPEQARAGRGAVSVAADVYGLGAVLYEALTGRAPFAGANDFETLLLVLERPPEAPRRHTPGVAADLETICLKCLEKEPRRRYGSALEVAEDLERWLRREPIRGRRVGAAERVWKWARRRPALAALAAVSVLAALAPLAVGWHYTGMLEREKENVEGQRDLAEGRRVLAEEKTKEADRERRRAQAEAEEAEWQAELSGARLDATRRGLYTAQLLRARAVAESDPVAALELLEDEASCPADLRDFAWGLLRRQCRRLRLTYTGHLGGTGSKIEALAVGRGGKLVASGGMAGVIKLWDLATGLDRATLRTTSITNQAYPQHTISALELSPDEKTLASAHWFEDERERRSSYEIKLWDVPSRKEIATLTGHDQVVRVLTFLDHGKKLFSSSSNASVNIWDLKTRKAIVSQRFTDGVNAPSAAISPDGKMIAVGGSGAGGSRFSVMFWDVETRKELAAKLGSRGGVMGLAFSPDRKVLASGSAYVHLWDTRTHQLLGEMEGSRGQVFDLAFSPDGKLLAAATDGRVLIWEVATRRLSLQLRDSTFWSTLRYTPDGRGIVCGTWLGAVKVWDVESGRPAAPLHIPNVHQTIVRAAFAFGPDVGGSTLVYRKVVNDRLCWWDATTDKECPVPPRAESLVSIQGSLSPSALCNGRSIATIGERWVPGKERRPILNVWDAQTGRRKLTLPEQDAFLVNTAFSPDGRFVALVSSPWSNASRTGSNLDIAELRVWDLETGKRTWALRVAKPGTLVFSLDSSLLHVSAEGGVKYLDARTGKEKVHYRPPVTARDQKFTRDGKSFAAIHESNSIKIREIETGEERTLSTGAKNDVWPLFTVSPDGCTLVTCHDGGTIKAWDLVTGHERMTLRSWPTVSIHGLAFSPDGTALAAITSSFPRGELGLQIWRSDLLPPPTAPEPAVLTWAAGGDPGWAALAGADETVYRLWLARLARKGLRATSATKHTSGGRSVYASVATHDAAPAGQTTQALSGEWELRKALAQALRDGKRPVAATCTPGNSPRFEVTFAADEGRDWRFRHGLPAAALKEELAYAQSRGEWPATLFSLPTPDGPRFGVVLVRRPELNWVAELDLTSAQLAKRLAEVKDKQLRPLYLAGYEQGRASRYTAVWDRLGAPPARPSVPPTKGVNNLQPHAFQPALRLRLLATNNCDLFYQDMSVFARGLWNDDRHVLIGAMYGPTPKGASFELALKVPRAGRYQLRLAATRAPDFARVQVSLDGTPLGKPIEGYAPRVEPTGWLPLGTVRLTAGEHRLRFVLADKDPRSTNYLFGVDGIDLVPAP